MIERVLPLFLLLWQFAAQKVDTSLGKFPGPMAVAEQAVNLYDEHVAERDKAAAFYALTNSVPNQTVLMLQTGDLAEFAALD